MKRGCQVSGDSQAVEVIACWCARFLELLGRNRMRHMPIVSGLGSMFCSGIVVAMSFDAPGERCSEGRAGASIAGGVLHTTRLSSPCGVMPQLLPNPNAAPQHVAYSTLPSTPCVCRIAAPNVATPAR